MKIILFSILFYQFTIQRKLLEEQVNVETQTQQNTPQENPQNQNLENQEVVNENIETPDKTVPVSKYNKENCALSLIQKLGLEGQDPIDQQLQICQTTEVSCCSSSDEMIISQKWTTIEQNLNDRFSYYNDLHSQWFEKLETIYQNAIDVQINIKKFYKKDKEQNECFQMSRKILTLRLPEILSEIANEIQVMQDFHITSTKGLFCSVCNYYYSQFMNNDKAIYSGKFCRDYLNNSFIALKYLNINLPQIIPLINNFTSQCNFKGEFLIEEIPETLNIPIDESFQNNIKKCNFNKDGVNWLHTCTPICNSFNPFSLSNYFIPLIEFLPEQILFLEEKLKIFEESKIAFEQEQIQENEQQIEGRILSTKKKHKKVKRKLENLEQNVQENPEEQIKDEGQEQQQPQEEVIQIDPAELYKDVTIIKDSTDAALSISQEWKLFGVDLYDLGLSADFIIEIPETPEENTEVENKENENTEDVNTEIQEDDSQRTLYGNGIKIFLSKMIIFLIFFQ